MSKNAIELLTEDHKTTKKTIRQLKSFPDYA